MSAQNNTAIVSYSPAIYVGTYHKYNSGSIAGAWINLDEHDQESFEKACYELHKDEQDPEFMFQDHENIPSQFITESSLDPDYWEYRDVVAKSYLDESVFQAADDLGIAYDDVEDLYQGEYSSDEDFAQTLAEEIGAIDENAAWPNNCIDWEYAARELMYDYSESNGHYFRAC